MNISNIAAAANATSVSKTSKTPTTGGLKETPKEAFLHLLVAQLEHQNPLEPVENTEFTAQLAQFTSLEQLQAMNTNITTLMSAQTTANGLQAAALIGRQVQAQGNTIQVDKEGQAAPFHYTLRGESTSVQISVTDKTGNTVRTLTLPGQKAGAQDIKWNGKDDQGKTLPVGDYHFTVEAIDRAGRAVAVDTSFTGTVDGVTYIEKNPYLTVGGTRVQLSDITRVNRI